MMRPRTGFSTSLLFAAGAACAVVPLLLAGRWMVGTSAALSIAGVVLGAAYVATIAPRWPAGVRLGIVTLLLGAIAAAISPGVWASWVALMAIVGVMRSGFLYRRRPARALAVESVLLSTGALVAAFVSGPTALSWAVAVWGFFLVQSLYFAVSGLRPSGPAQTVDPFVAAHRAAMRLLEDMPG